MNTLQAEHHVEETAQALEVTGSAGGPLRFCLIGAGRAGLVHGRNIVGRIHGAKLTSLCDPNEAALEAAGNELGIAVRLTDFREVVKRDDVDAVVIVTPTFLHHDVACAAASHGKHIFLEKPMALTVAESLDIIAATRKAQVKFQIGFMRRFSDDFIQARELIHSGEMGRVLIIKSTGRGPGGPGPWLYDLRKSNGIVAEVNSHDIDTLRWMTGFELQTAYAQGRNFKCPEARAEWPDFYDNVLAQFCFHGDTMGVIDGTCPAHYGYDARVEILCENGVLFVGSPQHFGYIHINREGKVTCQAVKSWRTLFKDAYLAEMEHFVHCVLTGEPPRVTALDGLRAVEAVVAINESIRTGQPVNVTCSNLS